MYTKKISRVCIVNNAYVLFQYFLLSSLEEIGHTFFFFAEDINDNIADRFEHARLCLPSSKIKVFFFLIWLKITSDVKWPFLKECEFWGQDNILITSPLLKNRKIILPEDGLLNYNFVPIKRKFKWIRRLLFGNLLSECGLGYSRNVDTMYLTGIKKIPQGLEEKVHIVDYSSIWKSSSPEKQKFIMEVFGISEDIFDIFGNNSKVLFTQPLSEDNILSEDEKIEIYKKIVENVGSDLIIKTHPREVTNYRQIFPENIVYDKPVPLELISLVGIQFAEVYTLFSTAVLNLPNNTKVNWLGCYGCSKLKNKYGTSIDMP